jgi:cobalamin biosynthesis Mg chelatase CobN
VLVVLALACFPGLAQANSSGAQYESDLPNVPHPESSPQPGENPGGPDNPGGEDDEAQISENSPGGGAGGGGDKGDSDGPGGEGNTSPAAENLGHQRSELKEGTPASHSDDSSSPLVPILIAVAVLAAISVGAFYYRQRRQGSGSPISPKAS